MAAICSASCSVCSASCSICSASCSICSASCSICSAICSICSASCSICLASCSICSASCSICLASCSICSASCSICSASYSVCSASCSICLASCSICLASCSICSASCSICLASCSICSASYSVCSASCSVCSASCSSLYKFVTPNWSSSNTKTTRGHLHYPCMGDFDCQSTNQSYCFALSQVSSQKHHLIMTSMCLMVLPQCIPCKEKTHVRSANTVTTSSFPGQKGNFKDVPGFTSFGTLTDLTAWKPPLERNEERCSEKDIPLCKVTHLLSLASYKTIQTRKNCSHSEDVVKYDYPLNKQVFITKCKVESR